MNGKRCPASLIGASLLMLAVCTDGCIYSYVEMQISWQQSAGQDLHTDNYKSVLDTILVKNDSYIFYPRDFSFSKRHGDGDWFYYYVKEPLCRFPTILIEMPFYLLNSESHLEEIAIPSADNEVERCLGIFPYVVPHDVRNIIALTNALGGVEAGVMSIRPVQHDAESNNGVVNLTYSRKFEGEVAEIKIGDIPSFDRIYFTGEDACYVMSRFGSWTAYNLSFFGFPIQESIKMPIPFLWRIDLKNGERELIAYYDGKIRYLPDNEP